MSTCSQNSKKLCKNLSCSICFQKSFASSLKSECWSPQNVGTPRQYFKSCKHRAIFKCNKCSNTFEMSLNNVSNGKWCRSCGHTSSSEKQRLSKVEFISRSSERHVNKYDYSKVQYKGCDEPVIIICPIHGEFLQTPYHHYAAGYGCTDCGIVTRSDKKRFTRDEFIHRAINEHGDKYDYSEVDYINSQTRVTIICKIHGRFIQGPNSHLQGCGCEKCGIIQRGKVQRLTNEEFISRATEVHANMYDYSKTFYTRGHDKLIIICKKHGEFLQDPYNHLKGFGCRRCAPISYSRAQIECIQFLSNLWSIRIEHALNGGEHNILNSRFRADGYVPNENFIIEFHGDYWHGNPKFYPQNKVHPHPEFKKKNITFGDLYTRTHEKELHIKEQGYKLKVIWESQWNDAKHSVALLIRHWRSYRVKKTEGRINIIVSPSKCSIPHYFLAPRPTPHPPSAPATPPSTP